MVFVFVLVCVCVCVGAHRVLANRGLADGTEGLRPLDLDPLVQTGPAKEVATATNHGILRLIQTDVALKVGARRGRGGGGTRGVRGG